MIKKVNFDEQSASKFVNFLLAVFSVFLAGFLFNTFVNAFLDVYTAIHNEDMQQENQVIREEDQVCTCSDIGPIKFCKFFCRLRRSVSNGIVEDAIVWSLQQLVFNKFGNEAASHSSV